MNQELELELTYLAKEIPNEIQNIQSTRIVDLYIPDTVEHAHLRLRQKGEKYEITKKTPVKQGDSSEQIEQTIPLTKEEFEALATCSQKKVIKDRYKIKINNHLAEVDIFQEKLAGLVLIDFEFTSSVEKSSFKIPEIALADVTQEEFSAGRFLSGKSYNDLAEYLAKFDYQKLFQE